MARSECHIQHCAIRTCLDAVTQGEAHVSTAVLAELAPSAGWVDDFLRHFLQCLRLVAAPACNWSAFEFAATGHFRDQVAASD